MVVYNVNSGAISRCRFMSDSSNFTVKTSFVGCLYPLLHPAGDMPAQTRHSIERHSMFTQTGSKEKTS